jgi:hypothetical protein
MSEHGRDHGGETPTPLRAIRQGGIPLEDRLENIEGMCQQILTKGNETTTKVALIESKLALHDTILMGVCGIVGVTIISAVLVKVVHS